MAGRVRASARPEPNACHLNAPIARIYEVDYINIYSYDYLMSEFHVRSRPDRGVIPDDETPTLVYLTVCTRDRKPWLANDAAHMLLRQVWLTADRWRVGLYVLMPDHVHLFAWPGPEARSFDRWVTYWKARFTTAFGNPACRWQKYSFHHRIRSGESCEAKWRYILENPVRAGLIERVEAWPYQGEIFKMQFWW
jgi:putative transposase